MSVRQIQDRFVLFPGSKNVHIAVRERADIALYNEPRFMVARNVATAFFDVAERYANRKRKKEGRKEGRKESRKKEKK